MTAAARARAASRISRAARAKLLVVQLEDVLLARRPGRTCPAPPISTRTGAASSRCRSSAGPPTNASSSSRARSTPSGRARPQAAPAPHRDGDRDGSHPARHLPLAAARATSASTTRRRWCRIWPRSASATCTARRSCARGPAAATATTSSITTAQSGDRHAATTSTGSSPTLREHGMGLLADMVPNHMGVAGRPTTRGGWTCWRTARRRRTPTASTSTGRPADPSCATACCCRCSATTTARCSSAANSAAVRCARPASSCCATSSIRLPIDPRELPAACSNGRCAAAAGVDCRRRRSGALASLTAAFVPPAAAPSRRRAGARRAPARQATVLKRNWRGLAREHRVVGRGDRARRCRAQRQRRRARELRALDALIERQAYRLAYWRVAADEINYRRFFDINELAALRMENARGVRGDAPPRASTLAAGGMIDGLRIDHPDGLADPGRLFPPAAAALRAARRAAARGRRREAAVRRDREDRRAAREACPSDGPFTAPPATASRNLVNGAVRRHATRRRGSTVAGARSCTTRPRTSPS